MLNRFKRFVEDYPWFVVITTAVGWLVAFFTPIVASEFKLDIRNSANFPAYLFCSASLIYAVVLAVSTLTVRQTSTSLAEVKSLAQHVGTISFVEAGKATGSTAPIFKKMTEFVKNAESFDVISYWLPFGTFKDDGIYDSKELDRYYAAIEKRIEQAARGERPFRYRRISLCAPELPPGDIFTGRDRLKSHIERVNDLTHDLTYKGEVADMALYHGKATIQTSYGIFYQGNPDEKGTPATIVWEVDAFTFDSQSNATPQGYILGLAVLYDGRGEAAIHFKKFIDEVRGKSVSMLDG